MVLVRNKAKYTFKNYNKIWVFFCIKYSINLSEKIYEDKTAHTSKFIVYLNVQWQHIECVVVARTAVVVIY